MTKVLLGGVDMRKSTVIARCMMNSGVSSLDDGELAVRATFQEEFPAGNFDDWNLEVDDEEGEKMVTILGERYKLLRIAEPRSKGVSERSLPEQGTSGGTSCGSGRSKYKRRRRKARRAAADQSSQQAVTG
jgi:hypothetical protein